MAAQRITLSLADGKRGAVITAGSIVSAGEVVIEIDDADIQNDVQVTITKLQEIIKEQLF